MARAAGTTTDRRSRGGSWRFGSFAWAGLLRTCGDTITQTVTRRRHVGSRTHEHDRAPDGLDSTQLLLEQARRGDDLARERLIARFLPPFRGWVRARVPRSGTAPSAVLEMVRGTLADTLRESDSIPDLKLGGFFVDVRGRLRERVARLALGGADDDSDAAWGSPGPSAFDEAIGCDAMRRYEVALDTLSVQQRAAVALCVELDLTLPEIADAVGCPSVPAARTLVARAIVRQSEVMDE